MITKSEGSFFKKNIKLLAKQKNSIYRNKTANIALIPYKPGG